MDPDKRISAYFFVCGVKPLKLFCKIEPCVPYSVKQLEEIDHEFKTTFASNGDIDQSGEFTLITNSNNLSLYYYEFRNQTQISSVKGLYRKMIPVDSKKKKITEKLPNDGPNCLHFFYKGKCALLVEKKLTLTKELGAYKELTILSMQNKDPSLKNTFEDLCSREQQLVKHISVLEEQLLKTCDQVEYVGGKERTEAFYVSLVGTLDAYNLEHNSRDATYNIPFSLKCCPYSGGSDIVIWRESGVLWTIKIMTIVKVKMSFLA